VNTPPLFASDLDRTLVYSPRAFWLETADADAPPIVVSEIYQGVPISFMTRAAESLLLELTSLTAFVPVTTRTIAQYSRIRLPGGVPRFAVTTNGGVILVDGVPDAAWSKSLREHLSTAAAPLAEIGALLADPLAADWILRVHDAEDLFVYAIVDREAMPAEWIAALQEHCLALGWTVSVQGRKLYCVPLAVDKSSAVAEVRHRLGDPSVFAAGDSLLDRRMLEEADVALRPAHGELHDEGFEHANLTVTESRGILAGEELLALVTREVLAGALLR
jgi:hypothetical protein